MTVAVGVGGPWATAADVAKCQTCFDYEFDDVTLDWALLIASNILYGLTGRQWSGVCTAEGVRPCARYGSGDFGRPVVGYRGWWGTAGYGGYSYPWFSGWGFCTCNRSTRSGCRTIPEVTLGVYPLIEVTQVKVGGDVLDPTLYRIDDDRFLVRLPDADGSRPGFPCCQDMVLPDTEPGTWSVDYTYGTIPDPAGVQACAEYACQLALACDPATAGRCQLPQRVTQVASQGVTMAVLDPMLFLEKGKTGLYLVDSWIQSVNPQGIARRAYASSPDIGRRVRRPGS